MKIKFLDTGEIQEVVSAHQLANTKVRVTPEASRQIQEAVFKLGFGWPGVTRLIKNEDESFLYLEKLSTHTESLFMLTYGIEESTFANSRKREFEFISPLEEPQPSGCQFGETDKLCNIDCECVLEPQPSAGQDNGWISTAERMPEFGDWVLVHCRLYGTYIGSYQQISDTKWGNWHDGKNLGVLPPTHWMPLPSPPKTSNS